MSELGKYLIPTETPVVVTRRHWASLARTGALTGAVFLVGLLLLIYAGNSQGVTVFALLVLLVALVWFGWSWWAWRTDEFVITDRRVLLIEGILNRKVAIMPLSKVTDLTYERSLGGRILGYGVFVVESAGQHQAFSRIEYLPTPDILYHDVSTLLFGPDSYEGRRRSRRDGEHPTTPLPPQR